jgi:hypothetical protein
MDQHAHNRITIFILTQKKLNNGIGESMYDSYMVFSWVTTLYNLQVVTNVSEEPSVSMVIRNVSNYLSD